MRRKTKGLFLKLLEQTLATQSFYSLWCELCLVAFKLPVVLARWTEGGGERQGNLNVAIGSIPAPVCVQTA